MFYPHLKPEWEMKAEKRKRMPQKWRSPSGKSEGRGNASACGHRIQLVSGGGKWQERMDKLERTQETLSSSACRHSNQQGQSHPGKVWCRQTGRARRRGGLSDPPKPPDTWPVEVKCQSQLSRSCQGGPAAGHRSLEDQRALLSFPNITSCCFCHYF